MFQLVFNVVFLSFQCSVLFLGVFVAVFSCFAGCVFRFFAVSSSFSLFSPVFSGGILGTHSKGPHEAFGDTNSVPSDTWRQSSLSPTRMFSGRHV